jgi:hypothetical protein
MDIRCPSNTLQIFSECALHYVNVTSKKKLKKKVVATQPPKKK